MATALATWLSAAELSTLLAVSAGTLELYASRGTLGFRVDERGRRLFDTGAAAAIFRRRGAPVAAAPGDSFGRLGEIALGDSARSPGIEPAGVSATSSCTL